MENQRIGVIGIGEMGSGLSQNLARHGHDTWMWDIISRKPVALYHSIPENCPYKRNLHPVRGSLDDLVEKVGGDGIYLLMVPADNPYNPKENPTQEVVSKLLRRLRRDGIMGDLGNAYWGDTQRRCDDKTRRRKGIDYFGIGISGGPEGALHGSALFPGGTSKIVYGQRLKKILESIAAVAEQDNQPCVTWIGLGGAGNYLKTTHNGVEYAIIQIIDEAYYLMRTAGMTNLAMSNVFARWNHGYLESFLIDSTSKILRKKDSDGKYVIDKTRNVADMLGTGTWTVDGSLKFRRGVEPIPVIYAAVESRAISAKKGREPVKGFRNQNIGVSTEFLVKNLEPALFLAELTAFDHGFSIMKAAAEEYHFGDLNLSEIAKIFRAGCVIRARVLNDIAEAYKETPDLKNLMAAPIFANSVQDGMKSLKRITMIGNKMNVPLMALDSARNYLLQYSNRDLPTNLTQLQRNRFGRHPYRRNDKPGRFTIDWYGDGKERKVGD